MTTLPALAVCQAIEGAAPPREQVERTATMMAREYAEATAEIRRLLLAVEAQTRRLAEAFPSDYSPFRLQHEVTGHRGLDATERDLGILFGAYKRAAWEVLVNHLGVKNIMSVKKRA